MRILILDNKKITKFTLPQKIEEIFLISYETATSNVEHTITVEAENEEWYLKSNGSVNAIQAGMLVEKVKLEEYHRYDLEIVGDSERVCLYCMPTIENTYYHINTIPNLVIGKNTDANIYYNNEYILPNHINIVLDNNQYQLKCIEGSFVYLNDLRVTSQKLSVGDVVFTEGLRIIWMGQFFRINNPLQQVSFQRISSYSDLESIDNTQYSPVNEEEAAVELYQESDYFFHTPRLRTVIEKEELVIDAPPNSETMEELPFILTIGSSITMLSTSLMSGYMVFAGIKSGERTFQSAIPTIVMCVAMIVGSFIIPRITNRYQKNRRKKKEKLRQKKYNAYLKEKEEKIQMIMNQQRQVLLENNKNLQECYDLIVKDSRNVWDREISDNDFLTVRIGMGKANVQLNIKAPEEHFTLEEDNLKEATFEIVNKSRILEDVPITFSFLDKQISAIICECSYEKSFLDGVMLQLMTFHSQSDLKIILFTDKKNEENWEYLKNAPHCWSDDKQIRFFGTDIDEYKHISSYLVEEFTKRKDALKNAGKNDDDTIKKQEGYKNFLPYYIIITDSFTMTKKLPIIQNIFEQENNLGFSLVMIEHSMKNLSNKCQSFIDVCEKNSCIFDKELDSKKQKKFVAEYNPTIDMNFVSKKLANIPVLTKDSLYVLPNMLSFLEMNRVSKIEQLNILNRWKVNNPVLTLKTPVGVNTSGDLFYLDLHEKAHGPHGLVAGSTGSGKSEFIITYILSLAVNYHPDEVQFVLIDYKGGGLAGAFENRELGTKIPHLAGTITNLDTSEMNRSLVSIESEVKRRQKMFNEARDSLGESTIDIYKYQKFYREGVLSTPIPHLFIISDEFAELKAQQPEFMDQLISISRIGRSLGVHLILATQKPSGVVNDQIWSNSKFKVCLKVANRSDSMEMLKKPDAASIKETGRFYLQVGYDDLFEMGQSAWCGAKYVPSDRIIKKVDDSIVFVDNVGTNIKSINDVVKKEKTEEYGEQLTNIVKYLVDLAKKENISAKQLWLESIPNEIYVDKLKEKYHYEHEPYQIKPVIGEYDNPQEQFQGLLQLDLTNKGNTVIYGMVGSGKENLLTTIIYSSILDHSPKEVNFYLIDMGAETLKVFHKMPHVGDIIMIGEDEKLINLFMMIDQEMDRRKELFADYSGNYVEYCKNSGKKEPLIVVVINSYESFTENYSKIADMIFPMIRDGNKYGISFIVTASATNTIRSRMAQNFNNKICLQLPDNSDYRNLLNARRGLFPAKIFGRGLTLVEEEVYEFQTAFICPKADITKTIKDTIAKMQETYTERAKRVPVMPDKVEIELVKEELKAVNQIPIGIVKDNLSTCIYNFQEEIVNLISANQLDEEKMRFIYALIEEWSFLSNIHIEVIDALGVVNKKLPHIVYDNSNFTVVLDRIRQELSQEQNSQIKTIYIFIGIGELKGKLDQLGQQLYQIIFDNVKLYKNSFFLLVDNYTSLKKLQVEQWYTNFLDSTTGIWLGEGVASQMMMRVTNLSMEDRNMKFPDMAFVIEKGNYMVIKHIVDNEKTSETNISTQEGNNQSTEIEML